MAAPVLQFKRGNAGVAGTVPALRPGEPAISLNNFDFFIGIDTSVTNNKFFGSHRYWEREDGTESLKFKLVDKDGTNSINLKTPDTLSGIVTYTLPENIVDTYFLKTNSLGVLEWSNEFPSIGVTAITAGIATFTDTTDNTLGDADTGAVQIDGGLGINKNVTVGGNLHVEGYSKFVGVVTFQGGTINLGDDNTDDINVGGEFISGLVPNTDDTHDLGTGSQRWQRLNVVNINTTDISAVGISTFTGLVDANGGLDVTGQVIFDDDLSVTGVSTFTGLVDANGGLDVLGHSELDNANISGIVTAASVVFGSGTAITSVDTDLSTVSGSDDTLASAKAIKDYVDTQITAQDLDIQADTGGPLSIDLDSEILTISGTANEIETDGSGNTITIGLPDNVIIGAALTVTGALDVNGGGTIDNIQIGVTGDNEIDTSSGNLTIDSAGGTVTIDDELIVSGDVRINGNDIKASDGNTNITLTSNTLTTFAGDIRVNGNDIQASDGNVNITMTSNTLTEVKGDLKVTGNDIQSSTATALTLSGANVTVAGDLTVGGNDIKASDGTTALTLADSTGAVTAANDLTVNGNLYVSGNTTQVNTAALTVEDRTIDLGIVNGAAPASATTWDLGILFNYNSSGAKKSAVIWEHSDTRFKFASVLAADTNGSNNDTPQLSVTTFAPIEIGALWVNDCAGQSQVISCTGSERFLENITVDAGTF